MADLEFKNVNKSFGDIEAAKSLNLKVNDGEFVVLLGPTGAGKTTLLRLAAGLEDCDTGEVLIGGKSMVGVPPAERDVTFVFQQYSLYPHLSVKDNLAFPLRSPTRNVSEPEIQKRIGEVAEILRISHKLDNKATKLSGGEMQRVAIGRALVRNPQIYFMDEPLSSLDAKLRSELRIELKRIQQEMGATIVYVTHDQVEAMTLAERVGVMREGELLQVGTPKEVYNAPCNDYVASRLGTPAINLISSNLVNSLPVPQNTRLVGVRTEHVQLTEKSDRTQPAKVNWIEHLGDQSHLHISLEGFKLTMLAGPHVHLKPEDQVHIELTNPLYFDPQGCVIYPN